MEEAHKEELKEAKEKIKELEEYIQQNQQHDHDQDQEIDNVDSVEIIQEREMEMEMEEVKEPISTEKIKDIAEMLQCNCNNPDELKSLELAMQLEAEEKQKQIIENNHLRYLTILKQTEANSGNLDVDTMSYEQLLELEDKIGIVSKGLSEDKISVTKCILKILNREYHQ